MMESTQRRAEQAATPLKSSVGDLRRAKSSGAASVQELKEFLKQHRGKRSQELLGELGKSNLFQAMVKSTIGCLALLSVLTVGPYLLFGTPEPKKVEPPAAAAATPAANTKTPVAAASNAPANNGGAPNGVDLDKAQKVLGVNETKAAPDNVNPREKDLDNLLDGVK